MTSTRSFCSCCRTKYRCAKLEIFLWEIYLLAFTYILFFPAIPDYELSLDFKLYLPFYRLNYKDLDLYVDRASENDLNNVLHNEQNLLTISKNILRPVGWIDPSCVMQSQVYVGMFEHAYLGYQCSDGIFRIEFYANESKNELVKTKVVGSYDIGVHYIQNYSMWGHLIHDFCASLMYLPEELHNKHFCIKRSGPFYAQTVEWIKFLGFKATVLDLKDDEQVYVNKLYFITGCMLSHSVSVGGIRRLREYVRKKLDLEKVKPCKFYILNREWNRKILNIDELLTEFNKKVPIDPGQQWQAMVPPIKDIASNGRFWSEIKALLAPCGSMIYNSIYMSEGTGLLLLYSHGDLPNFQLSIISKFYMIAIHFGCNLLQSPCNFNVEIQTAVSYMNQIVFAVNNKRWDKNHFHLRPPFHKNRDHRYNYDKIYDFNFDKNRFKKKINNEKENINITDKKNENENINNDDKKTEKENKNNNNKKKKKKGTNPDSYMTFHLGSIITNMMLLP